MVHAFSIWASMLRAAQPEPFKDLISNGGPAMSTADTAIEILKWVVGRSVHTLPAIGLALLEQITDRIPGLSDAMQAKGRHLKAKLKADLAGGNTVMLHPPLPAQAPFHDEGIFSIFDCASTAIFNVMELPVTQATLP